MVRNTASNGPEHCQCLEHFQGSEPCQGPEHCQRSGTLPVLPGILPMWSGTLLVRSEILQAPSGILREYMVVQSMRLHEDATDIWNTIYLGIRKKRTNFLKALYPMKSRVYSF